MSKINQLSLIINYRFTLHAHQISSSCPGINRIQAINTEMQNLPVEQSLIRMA